MCMRKTIDLPESTAELFARCISALKPPPELSVSQWADAYRVLSAESSASPGKWSTDNAPYQREIMDAVGDPHLHKVVIMSAAQLGKALDIETPLPTPDGWVKMEDVAVGDTLFDEDGHKCSVTGITDIMHGHTCYRMTFSDGSSLVADAYHKWRISVDKGWSWFVTDTKAVKRSLDERHTVMIPAVAGIFNMREIVSVVEVDSVPVKCIAVDSPNHLYLAGKSFIPTHNTDMLLNVLGYYMDYYPSPVMVMQPTLEMAQTFSKDRLAPMLRDTPALRNLVDTKSRYSGNTILKKNFPGGHVTMIGANSPTSLASRPIKVLLCDEVDRYPPSAGTEGDPLLLAQKRQTTFWDAKTVVVSTPTTKGQSRIEMEYESSTKEEWNIPCPECGHYQPLIWAGVIFDKENPEAPVEYRCERCGSLSSEYAWKAQGIKGRYVAGNPGSPVRGFHLNTLASPFCSWRSVVEKFLLANEALKNGDPEKMKTWVNTELGETWEESGERVNEDELYNRREIYEADVPDGVIVLTAGVDVQDNRFEINVVGWGVGKESWGIRYQKIFGDLKEESAWNDLDDFLLTKFRKADGTELPILAACVDSGGHFADQVYRFCKERWERRVWAIKGRGGQGVPYTKNPTYSNRVKAPLFVLGVDAGKAVIYQRLKVQTQGPNYIHFPSNPNAGYDLEFFRGLTSEQMVARRRMGRPVIAWVLRNGCKRNEPLDTQNYATAALELANPVLQEDPENAAPARPRRRKLSAGI